MYLGSFHDLPNCVNMFVVVIVVELVLQFFFEITSDGCCKFEIDIQYILARLNFLYKEFPLVRMKLEIVKVVR